MLETFRLKIHLKRGRLHLLRSLALGLSWLIIGWLITQIGTYGIFLKDVLYLPFVIGGLLFCWRDNANGVDKGLMAGFFYAIIFILIAIVFEGLLKFGTPPFFSNPYRQMFDATLGNPNLGELIKTFWEWIIGWPGVWGQLIGLTLFGGIFSYIKDRIAK